MASTANASSGSGRVSRLWRGPGRVCAGTLVLGALLVGAPIASSAPSGAVPLGTAMSFAVLGGSTVTNTGPSVISGNVGLSPGTAVTGFPPGIVNAGTIHATDGVAQGAQSDLTIAYNDAAGFSSTATISSDLAGRRLTPGVYSSASSLGLSGDLTLDAQGDPNAVFIFQAGSTLTAASGSRVLLLGGAQSCNVYWQVGSSATIGTGSSFAGNILALTSIAMTTGATLNGRALARNGAVTLDTNTITASTCSTPSGGSTTPSSGTTGSTGSTGTAGTTGTTTGTTSGKPGTRAGTGGSGGNSATPGSGGGTGHKHKHKHKTHHATHPGPTTRAAHPKPHIPAVTPKPAPKPAPQPAPALHAPPAFTG